MDLIPQNERRSSRRQHFGELRVDLLWVNGKLNCTMLESHAILVFFDSKDKASYAYEVAREVLKDDKEGAGNNQLETNAAVALARKAAFAGISDN